MRFKTTIILFACFLALLTIVLFLDHKSKDSKDNGDKLVSLSSSDVQKIVFQKEQETYTFQKNGEEEWLITQPLEAKADKYEVNRIAEDFSDLKIERVVEEEPQDLEKYGIPKKEISLYFKDKDQPIKILIGMENPLDNTFFAKKEGEKRVVLLPSLIKSLLEKSLFDFRQKDIFKFETDDVKGLTMRTKEIRWEAQKKDNEWFLTKPVKALAEKNEIDSFLRSLSDLKAKEFISEEKNQEEINKYGLGDPEEEIALFMPIKNQKVIFSLNKLEEKTYATTSLSPKIITIDSSILSDLKKNPEELREKKVADFFSWEANKLYLKKGDLNLVVAKDKENNWKFESPEKKEADKSQVETFIRKIESLEAKEFVDTPFNLKDFGLDIPQAEVKIWVKEDEGKVTEVNILLGTEDKEAKQVAVKNARFEYLFKVDAEFLQAFPTNIKDWEKKGEEKKNPK